MQSICYSHLKFLGFSRIAREIEYAHLEDNPNGDIRPLCAPLSFLCQLLGDRDTVGPCEHRVASTSPSVPVPRH